MSYAAKTTVTPEKSRAELERILSRYGANAFGYGYEDGRAVVSFRAHGRLVRFLVVVPPMSEFQWDGANRRRSSTQMRGAQEQAERQRWRALVLVVKAKLEAVSAGIASFEEEFLAHILLPDQTTVGEWIGPQLEDVYATGTMPSLLPGGRPELTAGR
jgi:hypothetical protein